jgi:hypothetical protein
VRTVLESLTTKVTLRLVLLGQVYLNEGGKFYVIFMYVVKLKSWCFLFIEVLD